MIKTRIATLAVWITVGVAADAQNILLNASFELPTIPANTIAIASPGSWLGNASTRIINGNYGMPELPGPQSGQQYLSLGNDGVLASASQEFTIIAPGVYVLSWFASGGGTNIGSPYSVGVLGSGGEITNVTNVAFNPTQSWQFMSIQLNLTSGSYTVEFRSQQPTPGGYSVQIDDVCLQANLLRNGSFESPTISAGVVSATTPTSWQTDGAFAGMIHGDYSPGYPLPQDGQQYAAVGNSTTLSQAFTIGSAGNYVLTWFDSTEYNGSGQFSPYTVTIADSIGNTVASADLDANATGLRLWTQRSLGFTLSPGTYTLRYVGRTGVFAERSLIDNVSVHTDNSDLLLRIRTSAVDICWAGFTNQMYQVQYRTNLADTNWFNLGSPVLGTGTNCMTDWINGNESRYYRTIRLP